MPNKAVFYYCLLLLLNYQPPPPPLLGLQTYQFMRRKMICIPLKNDDIWYLTRSKHGIKETYIMFHLHGRFNVCITVTSHYRHSVSNHPQLDVQLVQDTNIENIKAMHYWRFVRRTPGGLWISPQSANQRKKFICQGIIMRVDTVNI